MFNKLVSVIILGSALALTNIISAAEAAEARESYKVCDVQSSDVKNRFSDLFVDSYSASVNALFDGKIKQNAHNASEHNLLIQQKRNFNDDVKEIEQKYESLLDGQLRELSATVERLEAGLGSRIEEAKREFYRLVDSVEKHLN